LNKFLCGQKTRLNNVKQACQPPHFYIQFTGNTIVTQMLVQVHHWLKCATGTQSITCVWMSLGCNSKFLPFFHPHYPCRQWSSETRRQNRK